MALHQWILDYRVFLQYLWQQKFYVVSLAESYDIFDIGSPGAAMLHLGSDAIYILPNIQAPCSQPFGLRRNQD